MRGGAELSATAAMELPFAEIRNRGGERLDSAFHAPRPLRPSGSTCARPAVAVLAHGVTSHKDRPWLIELGDALAARGLAALRFSFSGNGASQGRFEDATLAKEVEDLGSVLDALAAAGFDRIAYAGHSMGGAIGVLRAAIDPRIRALVSLAGMLHVQRFMQRQFGALSPGEPMLGKPECRWSAALRDDAVRIGSLTAQAARITVPWLLVHGTADELVPFSDSVEAKAAAGGRPDLVSLEGVDHRFTGAIPAMVAPTESWLAARILGSGS